MTWRNDLSAMDRFRMVQKIVTLHNLSTPEALSLETSHFNSANSLTAYESLCSAAPLPDVQKEEMSNEQEERIPPSPPFRPLTPTTPGVTIGPFSNCHQVGSGVTSTVYRSGFYALKVIESPSLPPHNAAREIRILQDLKPPCIPLISLLDLPFSPPVLQFPYLPLTLEALLSHKTPLPRSFLLHLAYTLLTALSALHTLGIIHRDIKPSSLLLTSLSFTSPIYLSDFSSSWHPIYSLPSEPPDNKLLDIGTGAYRAPESLFGSRTYGPSLDMWAAGCLLLECFRKPTKSIFESPPANEDGNQLGLILSIFKTLGSPTRESWPEAMKFRTPPFGIYTMFEGIDREEIFGNVEDGIREIAENLIVYESVWRWTADKCLKHPMFKDMTTKYN